jgi:hypothetical protein
MRWIVYVSSFYWLKKNAVRLGVDYAPGTYDPLDGRIEVWALPGASEGAIVEGFDEAGIEYVPLRPGKVGTTGL